MQSFAKFSRRYAEKERRYGWYCSKYQLLIDYGAESEVHRFELIIRFHYVNVNYKICSMGIKKVNSS
jgi:hypothetical protein